MRSASGAPIRPTSEAVDCIGDVPVVMWANMEWFKAHVFIAAWCSPIITLIGLLVKKQPQGAPMNWPHAIFYVGFLSGLAILVIDPLSRGVAVALVAMGFGTLVRNFDKR